MILTGVEFYVREWVFGLSAFIIIILGIFVWRRV